MVLTLRRLDAKTLIQLSEKAIRNTAYYSSSQTFSASR